MNSPDAEGGTFVVVGACGGSGASLIAGALALCWARDGAPVWLMELDLERGDLGGAWDLPAARTLADLAAVMEEVDAGQLDRAAHDHPSGVRVILAPAGAGIAGGLDRRRPWPGWSTRGTPPAAGGGAW